MAKKPEPPKPIIWNVYVEATDEAAVMEKAAAEFKVPLTRLMAVRR